MANKDKPVFDNCRAGNVINAETSYFRTLFNQESIYEDKDDSDYFDLYRNNQNESLEDE